MLRVITQKVLKLRFCLGIFVFPEQSVGSQQQRPCAGARAGMCRCHLKESLCVCFRRGLGSGARLVHFEQSRAGFRFRLIAVPLVNRPGADPDRHQCGADHQLLLIDFNPAQKLDQPGRFGRVRTHKQVGQCLGRPAKRQGRNRFQPSANEKTPALRDDWRAGLSHRVAGPT